MLYDKSLDEINVFKMEILEVMIENENTEKEIKHGRKTIEQQLRAIYNASPPR